MTKKDPEKLARKREKKERKLLEQQIKQSNEKVAEGRVVLETVVKATGSPNYTKAIQILESAIELYPENSEAFTLRGTALKNQFLAEEAIDDFTKAFTLDPLSVPALEGRATCFELLREWDRAIHDYTTIVAIQPENDHAYNMRAAARLKKRPMGLVMRIADFESIVLDLKTALRLNENNFAAFTNLGRAYADQRMYRDAIEQFNRALKISDAYNYALYRRACARVGLGGELDRKEKLLSADLAEAESLAKEVSALKAEAVGGGDTARAVIAEKESRLLSVDDQIALEDSLEAVRKEHRELLLSAVADFTKVINPEAKQEELAAVIHVGMCYFDLHEDAKAKEELTFALKHIQAASQDTSGGGQMVGSTLTGASLGDLTVMTDVVERKLKQIETRSQRVR